MQRRQFLRHLPASVLSLSAAHMALAAMAKPQASPSSQEPRWLTSPFALGVASGEPKPNSVLLWTRLYPSANNTIANAQTQEALHDFFRSQARLDQNLDCLVHYEVFADSALKKRIQTGSVVTHAQKAWSVHVRVDNLEAHRPYWYRFRCGDAVSPVGKTQTTPTVDASAKRLRLGLASCQHFEYGYYPAHAEMATQDLDFVLFVGDYIYESSYSKNRIRDHIGDKPQQLNPYRERHALYKTDADLRANHAAHPWLCTWDDHEVENDYANDQNRDYKDPSLFLKQRAAAYQAYFEHMPVWPEHLSQGVQRIHRQWQWGQLADLWTLDCRQYRSPQPCRDPLKGGGRVVFNCQEKDEANRSMLGLEQERWLDQGLSQSKARWRLIAQSTQMTPAGIHSPLGYSIFTDGWDGYASARNRFLQNLAQHQLKNVVVLSGDVHHNLVGNLRLQANDEKSPILASEIVTTSISSRGINPSILDQIKNSNPDILYARSDERGYTLIDLEAERMMVHFRTTPHPAQAGTTLKTQAQYTIQDQVAGAKR